MYSLRHVVAGLAELMTTIIITILVDRWLSTPAAIAVLCLCLAFMTWHHWQKIEPFYFDARQCAKSHRVLAVLVVAILCCLAGFGGYKYYVATHTSSGKLHDIVLQMPPHGWLTSWGQTAPNDLMRFVADVTPIVPYRTHFNVMVVCLVADETMSEQDNPRIMRSSIYSIAESDTSIAMEVPIDKAIVSRYVADKPDGTVILPMRAALLLLPSSVLATQISKISDAGRLGGNLLTINGFPLTLVKSTRSTKIKQRP